MSLYYAKCPQQYFEHATGGTVKVKIANLVCGRGKSGVRIEAESQLSQVIPSNCGVLLAADIRYKEFKFKNEQPVYSMKIFKDEGGQKGKLLDIISISTEDQPFYFNPYEWEMRYKPRGQDEWHEGDAPLRFICEFDIVLYIRPWPHQVGKYKEEYPITAHKSVKVSLARGPASPLLFHVMAADPTPYGMDWNQQYRLLHCAWYKGEDNFFADMNNIRLQYFEHDLNAGVPTKSAIRLREVPEGDSPVFPIGSFTENGDNYFVYALHTQRLKQDWQFWYNPRTFVHLEACLDGLTGFLTDLGIRRNIAEFVVGLIPFVPPYEHVLELPGPFERNFKYSFSLSAPLINGNTITLVNESFLDVQVSHDKREAGKTALNYMTLIWAEYFVSLGLTALKALGILKQLKKLPFFKKILKKILLKIPAQIDRIWVANANAYLQIMMDPVEYDSAYKKRLDYQKKITRISYDEGTPLAVCEFYDLYFICHAIKLATNTAFNRYLSALYRKDNKSASMQKNEADQLKVLAENNILLLKKKYDQLQHQLGAHQGSTRHEALNSLLNEAKLQGLSTEQKQQLRELEFTEDEITAVEQDIKQCELEDLVYEDTAGPHITMEATENLFFDILEQVSEIDRIHRLGKNDQIRELLKYNLLSVEEFNERIDRRDLEHSYPIIELAFIDEYYKSKLKKFGIDNTEELLNRTRRKVDRLKVINGTGIPDKQLTEWINLANLMNLRGIGEKYALALLNNGVKTRAALARTDVKKLHGKLTDYNRLHRTLKRVPTVAQISKWKKEA